MNLEIVKPMDVKQGLVEDFRTPQRMREVFVYPEMVYQQAQKYVRLCV